MEMKNDSCLRVCHVVHWPKSGITSVVRDLIDHCNANGIESFVVLLKGDYSDREYFSGARDVFVLNPSRLMFDGYRALRKLLLLINPNVVHAHSFTPFLFASLTRLPAAKLISTVHSDYPYLLESSFKSRVKRSVHQYMAMRKGVINVAVSDHVRDLISTLIGENRLVTVYNGIPRTSPVSFGPESDNRLKKLMGSSKNMVVAIGRLSPEKNFAMLIRAFAQLKSTGNDSVLVIIGDGVLDKSLRELVTGLGCDDRVVFTGYLPNPAKLIEEASLLVCSSLHEGFGLVLLEAMRGGTAILSTPVKFSEYLASEECAILTEGFGVEDLKQGLIFALSQKAKHEEMIALSKSLFLNKFTLEAMGKSYIALYSKR
ncbi:hypothetical protein A3738_15715 [Oleiphilus sp. HI0066]|nr:hypothetical protein A3738_15715 [Oleiphilus sp. HI0066]